MQSNKTPFLRYAFGIMTLAASITAACPTVALGATPFKDQKVTIQGQGGKTSGNDAIEAVPGLVPGERTQPSMDSRYFSQDGYRISLTYQGLHIDGSGHLVSDDGSPVDYDALIRELKQKQAADYALVLPYLNKLPNVADLGKKSDKDFMKQVSANSAIVPTDSEREALLRLAKWGTLINVAIAGRPLAGNESIQSLQAARREIIGRMSNQSPHGQGMFTGQKAILAIGEKILDLKTGGKPKYTVYGLPGVGDIGFKDFDDLKAGYEKYKAEYEELSAGYEKKSAIAKLATSSAMKKTLSDAYLRYSTVSEMYKQACETRGKK